jgi:zinc transporter ZupT
MTMINETETTEVSNPLQIIVMNLTITVALMAMLKANGFGWLATLFIGAFGGACITIGAVILAVVLLEISEARRTGTGRSQQGA